GYTELVGAIADYAGVQRENIVLGAGSDDLIMLCARAFAGPGDRVKIAESPTYPMFEIAASLAGATCGDDDPALTFTCRPNNPTGSVGTLPSERPLVVDEAYFEYSGDSSVHLLDEDVIVLRTFSKAFGLAGARVGYALASRDVAAELNRRQSPAPISTLSAALALATLSEPPDVSFQLAERERLLRGLRDLGFAPLPSRANFLYVPVEEPAALRDALMLEGLAVRAVPGGVRISVRDPEDDDVLLAALSSLVERAVQTPPVGHVRRARSVRNTAETRMAVYLQIEGTGRVRVDAGAGLYDHLLEQLAFHGGFDLRVNGAGDFENGVHHVVEDCAITLGEAVDRALGDRRGLERYGDAAVPMDDALARAVVDLGGRRWAAVELETEPGLAGHFLTSLAQSARMALHVEASGKDPHHVAEAAYKAVGRALKEAMQISHGALPSTKGLM
ncbi:MAG: aminotransferase class I/II-fold pyridoxal phosphate-dependent enzyme, partial [Actinobacteria bacterium]|nr:aminotransferase class I/II-fold pyridoxal phosphate-dependent enzyme [Actinomycetota bacterium]